MKVFYQNCQLNHSELSKNLLWISKRYTQMFCYTGYYGSAKVQSEQHIFVLLPSIKHIFCLAKRAFIQEDCSYAGYYMLLFFLE
jgi:hypothetical protein